MAGLGLEAGVGDVKFGRNAPRQAGFAAAPVSAPLDRLWAALVGPEQRAARTREDWLAVWLAGSGGEGGVLEIAGRSTSSLQAVVMQGGTGRYRAGDLPCTRSTRERSRAVVDNRATGSTDGEAPTHRWSEEDE
ncbi:MAG: hypothetical protein M1837_004122 [Sclerophora amabilis]|nr:MAG: hypothetical protein M1837_004122 [Sclerophora amabilis]